ncbi:MAG: hypothetical protein SGCHY_003089 [Lobulomycetales sp.]
MKTHLRFTREQRADEYRQGLYKADVSKHRLRVSNSGANIMRSETGLISSAPALVDVASPPASAAVKDQAYGAPGLLSSAFLPSEQRLSSDNVRDRGAGLLEPAVLESYDAAKAATHDYPLLAPIATPCVKRSLVTTDGENDKETDSSRKKKKKSKVKAQEQYDLLVQLRSGGWLQPSTRQAKAQAGRSISLSYQETRGWTKA